MGTVIENYISAQVVDYGIYTYYIIIISQVQLATMETRGKQKDPDSSTVKHPGRFNLLYFYVSTLRYILNNNDLLNTFRV